MRSTNDFVYILLLFIFSNIPTEIIKAQKQILEPGFLDKRKTIDSLKRKYGSEAITYDKWDDKEPVDSCLTVCFINSSNIPLGIKAGDQFINIASVIKKALTNPNKYKSIYIIFVKKDNINGMEVRTHTSGMKVFMSEM